MMKRQIAIAMLISAMIGCGSEPWPPDVIARWDDGTATLQRVEAELGELPKDVRSGDALVNHYLKTAREVCVRSVLIRENTVPIAGFDLQVETELARRQTVVRSWVSAEIAPTITPSNEEIEAFYRSNPEIGYRPERRLVSHIFVRADRDDERVILQSLVAVRTRVEAGEKFDRIALELSDSETRDVGGLIGWVQRNDMQQAAEDAVFGLDAGEVSDPVRVHGGFAVFMVSQVFGEKRFPLADVQREIRQHLAQQQINARLDDLAAGTDLLPGAFAIGEGELHEILETGEPGDPVYQDDRVEITVAAWRGILVAGTSDQQRAQYADFLKSQRLYAMILQSGFLPTGGAHEKAIERSVTDAIERRLSALIALRLITEKAAEDEAALARWYDDNRLRYQTPIELHLSHVIAAPGSASSETAGLLRALADEYDGGDLGAAVATIDGARFSRKWVTLSALDSYHPKVKASLSLLTPPACAPLFHLNDTLQLFCVDERRQPRQMSDEEARDRVVDDYVATNEQQLYDELQDEVLRRLGFEFNEDRVREVLHAPAIQGSNAS